MSVVRGLFGFQITVTGSSSGDFASRPAASTAGIGHVYTATDVGLDYVSTGTRWLLVEIASLTAEELPFEPGGTISAANVQEAIEEVAAEAGSGSTPTGTGFRHVTSGTEDGASKLVEIADVHASLKPSGSAATTDESLRALGTAAGTAAAGNDSRLPTSGEKAALAGTSGTPGSGNKYVTDGDARNTDARTPTAHKTSHEDGGSDEISIAGLAGTSVELAAHLADTTDAHDASAISADSTTLVGTGTDVQAVLEELDNGIADHLADTTDAHAGTAITNTPAGNIAATTVQAAINELDTEKQPLDAELSALAGLTSAADKLPYFSGSGTAALADLSAFIRTLLDDANAAAALATLGAAAAARSLTAGSGLAGGGDLSADRTFDVNVDGSTLEINADTLRVKAAGILASHIGDAELSALAGLTSAADKLPYFTGSGSAALADLSSFGRSLIDDASASAARTTLGVAQAVDAGYAYTFDTGTTDADPGTGKFRFNNATIANVTKIYINTTDAWGQDLTNWLASLDDFTGVRLTIRSRTSITGDWVNFTVTGANVSGSGYVKLTVTEYSSSSWGATTTAGEYSVVLAPQVVPSGQTTEFMNGRGLFITPQYPWTPAFATADQAVINQATLQNSTYLHFSMTTGVKYRIRGVIFFDTTAAGDFKFGWSTPTVTSVRGRQRAIQAGGTIPAEGAVLTALTASTSLTGTGTTGGFIDIDCVFVAGSTAEFRFQFAQNTATNDTGAIVLAGSYLEYAVA